MVTGMISTNLSAIADWLRPQRSHRKLVGLIDRATSLGTISEDLREAGRCLDLLERLHDRHDVPVSELAPGPDTATVTGALFAQAILLYARATAQGGNKRMALLQEQHVPAELRGAHRRIQNLRSQAIAHYGDAADLLEAPLVRVATVFSFQPTETGVREQTNILATRAQHKVEVAHDLRQLVKALLDHIEAVKEEELNAVPEELEVAVRADNSLGHALPQFPFDSYEFCGTDEAGLSLAMGLQRGVIEPLSYAVQVAKPSPPGD